MSSKDDILSSATEGITKGAMEWTSEKIKQWVKKFRDRNLAFIEDNETIDIAKEQRKSGEWDFFKKYIKDNELRILFQIGLTLRKLERENKPFKSLQEKIVNKYDTKGLHIAHFVQNGLFSKYVGNILERVTTRQRLTLEIKNLFQNIDSTVMFIKRTDKINQKVGEIVTKIQANSPKTFIISGSKPIAMNKVQKIKNKVVSKISGYTCESYDASDKEIYFLNRTEEII